MHPETERAIAADGAAVEELGQSSLDALVDIGQALLLGGDLAEGLLVDNGAQLVAPVGVVPATAAGVRSVSSLAASGVSLR